MSRLMSALHHAIDTRLDRRLVVRLMLVMLAADAVFIALHLFAGARIPVRLRLTTEWGIPELIEYAEWLAAAALMVHLSRTGSAVYRVWAGVFAYMFLDDAYAFHEGAGELAAMLLRIDHAAAFGEVVFFGAVGILLLSVLAMASRTATALERRYAVEALGLLALFALFSVGGDLAHQVLTPGNRLVAVIEDGGEMVMATFLLTHAALHVLKERAPLAEADAAHVRSPRTGPVAISPTLAETPSDANDRLFP